MRILTIYQKFVLQLLCAILGRLIGLPRYQVSGIHKKLEVLINRTQDEIDKH